MINLHSGDRLMMTFKPEAVIAYKDSKGNFHSTSEGAERANKAFHQAKVNEEICNGFKEILKERFKLRPTVTPNDLVEHAWEIRDLLNVIYQHHFGKD